MGACHPGGADVRRLRGLVPDLRPLRPGRRHLAGRLRRPRPERRRWPVPSRPCWRRSTWVGSTRSGSTWPRRPCSPTAPRSSACASCRRWCATRRCGASCSASRAPAPTWPRCACRAERDGDEWVAHRPEGLDHLGPQRRLRGAAGPHRPRPAQAQGHHLLPGRPAPARRRGAGPAPHHRRDRLQRDLPRRRPGARLQPGGRGRRRLEGRQRHPLGRAPDGVGVGLGRRRPHRRLGSRAPGRDGQGQRRGRTRAAAGTTRSCASRSCGCCSEERIRGWTNQRVRAGLKAGRSPGPESSIGKVHQGSLNQRIQAAGHRPARRPRPWPGRTGGHPDAADRAEAYALRRCPARSRACCAAGPTPSRAAPPR